MIVFGVLYFETWWHPTPTRYAGAAFGTVIAMPACGYLCEYVNWESVFYVFGAFGVVWFIVWAFLVFDGPDVHPRISQQEKDFLEVNYQNKIVNTISVDI